MSKKIIVIGSGFGGLSVATRLAARGYEVELFEKRADRAMIIVSHDPGYIRAHCNLAAVLSNGRLSRYDSVDEAFESYNAEIA